MAFLVPIGVAMAGMFGATATGVTAGLIGAATVGAAGYGAMSMMSGAGGGTSQSGGASGPSAPASYAATFAAEQSRLLQATQKQTKTILTSPLGLADDPSKIKRKLLLGQ
jgi:disulfide bond formation protein DsbB